jgi:hypothetical protein
MNSGRFIRKDSHNEITIRENERLMNKDGKGTNHERTKERKNERTKRTKRTKER